MQNIILDIVFTNIYETLEFALKDCEIAFKREIIKSCQLRIYLGKEEDELSQEDKIPIELGQTGKMFSKVLFILSGSVHIMNKTCMYEYGILHKGCVIGDISLLMNEANSFSYFFNQKQNKPLILLQIPSL